MRSYLSGFLKDGIQRGVALDWILQRGEDMRNEATILRLKGGDLQTNNAGGEVARGGVGEY